MLKLTRESIWKIKLLQEEKEALLKLFDITQKKWYKLYLFGSRLSWYWADIDLMIKPSPSLKELIKFESIFSLYTDTKLDLVPYKEETAYFLDNILTK